MNYADFIFSLQAIQDLPDSTSLDPRPILHSSRRHKSRTKERADSLKENKDGNGENESKDEEEEDSFKVISSFSFLRFFCISWFLCIVQSPPQ